MHRENIIASATASSIHKASFGCVAAPFEDFYLPEMPFVYLNPLAMLAELQAQRTKKRHLRDIAEAIDVEYEEIYEQPNSHDDENNQTMVD